MVALKPRASDNKGPRGQLVQRCEQCHATGSKTLALCTGCRVVRYCCRDHQVAHRLQHKEACNKIKKQRVKVAEEDQKVRHATPDGFMTPANAFETHIGHFWGMINTRDYMRARFFLADATRRIGTVEGVQEGLDHMRDMLRLCRSDNMGVRQIVPALMLQLDLDQECYDFMKWYSTDGQASGYDWGNMELPFLSVRDADVFEATGFMARKDGDAHHCTTMILLKLKVLIDIINIRLTRKVLNGKLPIELWQAVELAVIRSPLSVAMTSDSSLELVGMEGKLVRQLRSLGECLRQNNDNVITGLLGPDEWLTDIPETMCFGSADEMQIILQHQFAAWWQTEGALELLRNSVRIAAADSEPEIDDMMTSATFKSGEGSDRTREELLHDVSLNRVWGYISYAVQDAGSLHFERPSDAHLKALREMVLDDDS